MALLEYDGAQDVYEGWDPLTHHIVVPGTGLIPSNRGSQSRPDPRHPAGELTSFRDAAAAASSNRIPFR